MRKVRRAIFAIMASFVMVVNANEERISDVTSKKQDGNTSCIDTLLTPTEDAQWRSWREERIEDAKRNYTYHKRLVEDRASLPQDPRIVQAFLDSMEADINGDFNRQMEFLESVYTRSLTDKDKTLWKVLRSDMLTVASQLVNLTPRLKGYSYGQKIAKYDQYSHYRPDMDTQCTVVNAMLLGMEYDAVFRYCAKRVAEGDAFYGLLRAELRVLVQIQKLQEDIVRHHEEELWRTLDPKDFGVEELTESLVHEQAMKQYHTAYDPSGFEHEQADKMLEEIVASDTRDVEYVRKYCLLLLWAYRNTHANNEGIEAYLTHASTVVAGPDVKFAWTSKDSAEERCKEVLEYIEQCKDDLESLSTQYAEEKRTGNFGKPYSISAGIFVNLDARIEREKKEAEAGRKVAYLSYEDVFGVEGQE